MSVWAPPSLDALFLLCFRSSRLLSSQFFFLHLVIVVTQILGHLYAGSSPPPHYGMRLYVNPKNTSVLSSLVDSHRIAHSRQPTDQAAMIMLLTL